MPNLTDPQCAVTAIVNQKGGVGKTTATLLLASALAQQGKRVALVDFDPQCNATSKLAPDFDPETGFSAFDVFKQQEQTRTPGLAQAAIIESGWGGVWLLPGDIQLARYDDSRTVGSEQTLSFALRGLKGFDHVLIDCNRALGPLTEAALTAARNYVIVTDTTADGLNGIVMVEESAEKIRTFYNENLALFGIIANRYDARAGDHRKRVQELRDNKGDDLLDPVIPYRPAVFGKLSEHGMQLTVQDSDSGSAYVAACFDTWAKRLHTM